MLKSPVIVKGYLINLSIFDVWVYKKLSKFPVTIEGIFKNFTVTPPQIDIYNSSTIRGFLIILINFIVSPSHFGVLMSVTIEGTFKEISKTFADDPLKTPLKSPVLLKEY